MGGHEARDGAEVKVQVPRFGTYVLSVRAKKIQAALKENNVRDGGSCLWIFGGKINLLTTTTTPCLTIPLPAILVTTNVKELS